VPDTNANDATSRMTRFALDLARPHDTKRCLTSASAVGLGTLRRVRELATGGQPVLSVYLDLGDGWLPTAAGSDAELGALIESAGADEADADRVRELLRARPQLVRSGHGLAIFSTPAGVLEVVALPGRVRPIAVLDTVAWLEPLVAMVSADDWGVAILGRRVARLFRGGPGALVEFATIPDEPNDGHQHRGWSQTLTRRSDRRVAKHLRRAIDQLQLADQRQAFEHLVIVAADELWPVIRASLHASLRLRLTAHVALDLERAGAQEITRVVAPVVHQAQRARERELLRCLWDALASGGPAVAGLDAVLASLRQRRIQTLIVADGAQLTATRCPHCGRLSSARENRRCPLDGAALAPVDAVDHAIEHARRQRADVVVFCHESAGLREHGSIAALLHW